MHESRSSKVFACRATPCTPFTQVAPTVNTCAFVDQVLRKDLALPNHSHGGFQLRNYQLYVKAGGIKQGQVVEEGNDVFISPITTRSRVCHTSRKRAAVAATM